MSIELNNLFNNESLLNFNIEWNWQLSNEWADEAQKALALFNSECKANQKAIEIDDEITSQFAEEGSMKNGSARIDAYYTKETQSSPAKSDHEETYKAKRKMHTLVRIRDLEEYVKREIEAEGYDSVINFCLVTNEDEEEGKVTFKKHNSKSKTQLKKLKEALERFPEKFPIKEREKLAKEIGLTEEQIYRWYYEHNPSIGKKRNCATSKRR